MSREFAADGRHVPVTVLALDGCRVVARKTAEKHGYDAVQLGVADARLSRVTKPLRGHYAKAGVPPRVKLAEFRVDAEHLIEVGAEISAEHFVVGQYVDAQGVSMGKGFAGAMKRHHFRGGRASHGVSVSHRAHGSTGQHQEPGKVFKGKKMAGHMGAKRRTVQNLEVVRTDGERGLILVRGGVPGPRGGWIVLRDACKRPLPAEAPHPAGLRPVEEVAVEEPEQVAPEPVADTATDPLKKEKAAKAETSKAKAEPAGASRTASKDTEEVAEVDASEAKDSEKASEAKAEAKSSPSKAKAEAEAKGSENSTEAKASAKKPAAKKAAAKKAPTKKAAAKKPAAKKATAKEGAEK